MHFIEIKNLKKIYKNGKVALNSVSFDIQKGEILGLLGVNGSGKTTLSSILATLHPPTDGDILYNGRSIFDDVASFRHLIGYCPQKPNLNPLLTVEQNLYYDGIYFGLSKEKARGKMESLLEQFSLREYRGFKASMLSGGYQQRVMIVRALMHNPDIIIFDEPTVGLDPAIRKKLWDIIKGLDKTVLITTHYLDEAEVLSDRICILDHGNLVLIDKTENIKQQHGDKSLEDIFIKLTEEETK